MISVRCLLCLSKSLDQLEKLALEESWTNEKLDKKRELIIENAEYGISSKLITKNDMEAMQALGNELVVHMQAIHMEELKRIALLQVHFNGFNAMKYFETKDEDSLFEKEKEGMREKLLEEIMMFAPDDEFEDEDEDDLEDENDEGLFPDEDEEEEDELLAKKEMN